MTEYEKVHFLTEAIFKNVLDNFNPGLKQLISTGRALQKALHNVSTQTKAYVECIYSLAQSAQVCKGATSDIGGALLQVAEVHKEINTQVIDNIKSFHSDLLIPLETKQENEFKHLQLIHKKYLAGHKFHQTVYDKAQNALKKHRKKAKSKYGFDQKELQYAREVKESYQKLEEYQMQNLRLALLEERKRYCCLLDRICAMVRNYASHHSKAHELFTHRLSEWTELCRTPHILPESSESIINAFKNQDDLYTTAEDLSGIERRAAGEYDRQSGNCGLLGEDSNSYTYGTTQRLLETDNRCHNMTNGMLLTQQDYPGSLNQETLASAQNVQHHARALYTHSGIGDTQLSFVTGDVIMLIGEARGGWQYGENTRTHRMGWFPVSFTEPLQVEDHRQTQDFRLTTQRVKSLSNLADLHDLNQDYRLSGLHISGHSDSDSMNVHLRNHRIGSHGERPMSLNVGAMAPSLQLPSKHRTDHGPEVSSVVTSPQEQALPLPPPPLPPPNNPPPPTDNNPGNCCQTLPGGGAHAVLTHTASSPALMRNANPSQAEHQQMLQSHVYVQSSSQPSPLRHGLAYTTSSKGTPSHCPRGHHNPDCVSRSEMSYMQVAPPTVYCNSAPSPANSSSGYSSGTTQASHGSSFSRRVSNDGSDLPPPPPPPKHTLIQSSAPPPPHIPPPGPPSNSNTDSKTQPGSQSNMYSMCRHGQVELLTIPHYY